MISHLANLKGLCLQWVVALLGGHCSFVFMSYRLQSAACGQNMSNCARAMWCTHMMYYTSFKGQFRPTWAHHCTGLPQCWKWITNGPGILGFSKHGAMGMTECYHHCVWLHDTFSHWVWVHPGHDSLYWKEAGSLGTEKHPWGCIQVNCSVLFCGVKKPASFHCSSSSLYTV